MANIDKETIIPLELTTREETERAGLITGDAPANVVDDTSEGAFSTCQESKGQDSNPSHLIIGRPPSSTNFTSGSSVSPGVNVAHPKRFSAVNINKKFLEKNSSASGAIQTTSSSVVVKSGVPVTRPNLQPPPTHSRLVTTKLTAAPQASITVPGWSRPSSATPPVSSLSSPVPNVNTPIGPSSAPTATQLPHAGKVIQPQPRTVTSNISVKGSQKDGAGSSSKPAWGNVKAVASSANSGIRAQNDFPTAAEVAQVSTSARKAKVSETKEAAETVAALKQTRMEEADTFRGVHLDPNAHHWDEMPEDDDNFLDGIIEFGDGRQYTIQSTVSLPQSSSPPPELPRSTHGDDAISSGVDGSAFASNMFVSKEERFADDFDRSWPRSKPSPVPSQREVPTSGHHPVPISPASSQHVPSPKEPSRVLFNERSNKLEPYSTAHPAYRAGQASFPQKRGNHSESTSPAESRSGRDLPPHSQAQNVQLLQKPGSSNSHSNDFPSRPRGFSGGYNERSWDREAPRRDTIPPSTQQNVDSKRTRDHYNPSGLPPLHRDRDRDRDYSGENRIARSSTMGPPPFPVPPLHGHHKESGRQLPPHLSPSTAAMQRRLPSQDPRVRPSPTLPPRDLSFSPSISSAHLPSRSPVLSQVAVVDDSSTSISGFPEVDLDEVRKDVMQSAAARAKERRKQEEEEREKEKERARRKAAELEAKIKAAEVEKEKAHQPETVTLDHEAVEFIENAVKGIEMQQTDVTLPTAAAQPISSFSQPASSSIRRPPSLKGLPRLPLESPRQMPLGRTSQPSISVPTSASTPAAQAESWRSKAGLPISSVVRTSDAIPVFPAVLSTLQDDALTMDIEELEVVDFSDFGKFAGADTPALIADQLGGAPNDIPSRPSRRPVALDFFQDGLDTTTRSDVEPWRRKPSHGSDRDNPQISLANEEHVSTSQSVEVSSSVVHFNHVDSTSTGVAPSIKENTPSIEHNSHSSRAGLSISGQQRTPRSAAFYKEADLSAWDDAMSRIKGALDGMQATDPHRGPHLSGSAEVEVPMGSIRSALPTSPTFVKSVSVKEPRWIPPALRARHQDLDIQSCEVFPVAGCEPPRSPNVALVQLPAGTRSLEPLNKKQLHMSKVPVSVRWDILSWDPPIEGMTRRDFSLNDVLFRKQHTKGKPKYKVLLPRSKLKISGVTGVTGPRVNLPANTVTPKFNTFGRFSEADGAPTWRKPIPTTPRKVEGIPESPSDSILDTVSRSPPPQLPDSASTTLPKPDVSLSNKGDIVLIRSRSQPKMPAGSVVAFYRDSRIDAVDSDPDTLVNFIVNSELEDPSQSSPSKKPIITLSSPPLNGLPVATELVKALVSENDQLVNTMVNGLKSQPGSPECEMPVFVQSKSSDGSTDPAPITPPTHHANTNATWAKTTLNFNIKESPARAPDPEHLKAVWSQASDKARLPAVNSLEGIADDLTALPFTLQDVKSEDGETPPPSISVPPRISLHDVTRAFQQVPSSSSNSTAHRAPPLSPSSASVPLMQRQPSYAYALPPPTNADLRQSFAPYPSPMMSHSPTPAMMYSHPIASSPVPSRMPVNGHAPVYSPPLWMPLSGPATQNHGGMMRPLASPYPAQLMPYPSASTPAVYGPPANMQNSPQNGSQTRGRGMPLMSPAMSHAGTHQNVPLYAGSPVLMHASVMQLPQGHTYMSIPSNRRNDVPGHPPVQQPNLVHTPTHNTGYTSVPPTSFVRPTW